MNTLTHTLNSIISLIRSTLIRINTKILPQQFLFLLTGFLVSQFFLLNILYSQHPQGGWGTLFGNISTLSLLTVVLLAIIACLVALWRSATGPVSTTSVTRKDQIKSYSKPATFMSVSPE